MTSKNTVQYDADSNAVKNITIDVDDVVKNPSVGITIDRNDKDGSYNVLIGNPTGFKGNLSSTGKTFVIGSSVERYGKLKISVMVTRDNK